MFNESEDPNTTQQAKKLWPYLKKNGISILMIIAVGAMLTSPDAKSFVLTQIMKTGLFNANISDKDVEKIASAATRDFTFYDDNGTKQNTSSLRGKVVFINFWASWCPPCRAEFPSIESLYLKHKDNPDVFFLTINQDSDLATAKEYLSKEKYSLPLYTVNAGLPKEIFSGSLPTTVVLDKKGKIRFHHTRVANYNSAKFEQQIKALTQE